MLAESKAEAIMINTTQLGLWCSSVILLKNNDLVLTQVQMP